jgi:hypothetical protein
MDYQQEAVEDIASEIEIKIESLRQLPSDSIFKNMLLATVKQCRGG